MELVLFRREILKSSKLQGPPNYALWAYKLRILLQGKKVWKVVNPNYVIMGASSFNTIAISVISTFGVLVEAHVAKAFVKAFAIGAFVGVLAIAIVTTPASLLLIEKQQYRMTPIIVPTVKDWVLPNFINMLDPRCIRIKLRDLYQFSFMNRRLSLKLELYNICMIEKKTIEEHFKLHK